MATCSLMVSICHLHLFSHLLLLVFFCFSMKAIVRVRSLSNSHLCSFPFARVCTFRGSNIRHEFYSRFRHPSPYLLLHHYFALERTRLPLGHTNSGRSLLEVHGMFWLTMPSASSPINFLSSLLIESSEIMMDVIESPPPPPPPPHV